MKKKRKLLPGYTLLELLIVMGIFIILGALGVGGYIGTRETMIARENVETVIQDVRSARLKAMLLEKGDDDNWIYGIGIDFYSMSPALEGATTFFKWCSPFEDFGNEISKSNVLGFVESEDIGDAIEISSVLGASTDIMAKRIDDPSECNIIRIKTPCPPYQCCYCAYTYLETSCTSSGDTCCKCKEPYTTIGCDPGIRCCPATSVEPPVSTEPTFKNGYISTDETTTCEDGKTSLVKITGNELGVFSTVEGVELMGARYLVFEAITGRAFLYADNGSPVNYDPDGDFTSNSLTTLDIVFKRKSSTKFDMVSVYPLSGTVIHHVYSNADKNSGCTATTSDCIVLNGVGYDRYSIADEINSYR